MAERKILLDCAAFLDSPQASKLGAASKEQARRIVQRFLEACYDDLGLAPRLLDGEAFANVLQAPLARRFGPKDPLAQHVEAVLSAYLDYLHSNEVVIASYEQKQALSTSIASFQALVKAGSAGLGPPVRGKTVAHHVQQTGRNDPCPCGSGKKFKKCCMGLGGRT